MDQLKKLYLVCSKHSNYQVLPDNLAKLINAKELNTISRFEKERLDYLKKNLNIENKLVLDVGGNTGYFSFEMLECGAKKIDYFEGNNSHSEFVKLATKLLNFEEKIKIHNKYLNFKNELKRKKYDVILLLNVLHHIGDDYDQSITSIERAKQQILKQLNSLYDKTTYLVFQMGFNWQGNTIRGLFSHGTKREMIDYVRQGIIDFWGITKIGIAEKNANQITYRDLNDDNIKRDDSLGEFLNRPIFILKTKKQ